jgi:hypothetical protein
MREKHHRQLEISAWNDQSSESSLLCNFANIANQEEENELLFQRNNPTNRQLRRQ